MSFGINDSEWVEPVEEPVPKVGRAYCWACPLWHYISSAFGWCEKFDETTAPTGHCTMTRSEWLEINGED